MPFHMVGVTQGSGRTDNAGYFCIAGLGHKEHISLSRGPARVTNDIKTSVRFNFAVPGTRDRELARSHHRIFYRRNVF